MKKLMSLSVFAFIFVLVGCQTGTNSNKDVPVLTRDQSLALSAYLSSDFYTTSNDTSGDLVSHEETISPIQLLGNGNETTSKTVLELDHELDEVNQYFNKLKVFMDKGLDNAIDIEETASTREEFDYQVTYSIDEETYTIYYSFVDVFSRDDVDELTGATTLSATTDDDDDDDDDQDEIRNKDDEDDDEDDDKDEHEEKFKIEGLMIIDDVEYELVGIRETEDDESKMWFATVDGNNDGNSVRVEMKEEDGEQKFKIESNINGVQKNIEVKFEVEDNETKIELEFVQDGQERSYEFKKETEDGETVYKFEYEIGDTEGKVKIYEETDESGNISYRYKIDEDGKGKGIERRRTKQDDEDDDEDEEDNDDEGNVL